MPGRESPSEADFSDFALLVEVAREAADFARPMQSEPVESWQKADLTPVSAADLAVDRFLRDRLRRVRPGYGWLSEESDGDPADAGGRTFVVDPIDGTRAFLGARDTWTICLAVIDRECVRVGAVVNPVRDDLYCALYNGGAFLNGEAIAVTNHASVAGARFAGGQGVYALAPRFEALCPPATFINAASMALRLSLVAAGVCDATAALTAKSDWDLAAGMLLVHEAGGRVSDSTGATLTVGAKHRHATLAAANPTLHSELIALLNDSDLSVCPIRNG